MTSLSNKDESCHVSVATGDPIVNIKNNNKNNNSSNLITSEEETNKVLILRKLNEYAFMIPDI